MKPDNIVQWDGRYKEKTHRSAWPWSDLVSLCERHVRPVLNSKDSAVEILEIGCGFGANIPYLLTLGDDYYGVDGSETCLREVAERFPSVEANLCCADFTEDLGFDKSFDLIVDRGSVTCNSDSAIRDCVRLITARLRPGGLFCGITWFSKDNSEYLLGLDGGDPHTRTGYTEGSFANTGTVHFTDETNLGEILSNFKLIKLEHKISKEIVPANGGRNAFFNFVAQKI